MFLSFYSIALLRLTAAGVFFYLVWFHYVRRKEVGQELAAFSKGPSVAAQLFALIEVVVAVALLIGFWTQIAALVGMVLCLKAYALKRNLPSLAPLSRSTYLLLFAISLFLLVNGAGPFAFDIPKL